MTVPGLKERSGSGLGGEEVNLYKAVTGLIVVSLRDFKSDTALVAKTSDLPPLRAT